VIIGKLIPAGTGLASHRNFEVDGTEEAKAERYPNRVWEASTVEQFDGVELESAELSFSADPFGSDE
jgi:DNA-directed RNA polymerase subunit beta'